MYLYMYYLTTFHHIEATVYQKNKTNNLFADKFSKSKFFSN